MVNSYYVGIQLLGETMTRLSSKRQVTLPKSLCDRAGLSSGDEFKVLEHDGHITLIKQTPGASDGLLRDIQPDERFSEEESRDDGIQQSRDGGH
ncbi:AbrB family transcriptional regulator [Halomonas sp. 22501_18_FS]|uniref:AbrB family transcriptional regulator n=2 Tax=Oceanospirillales TaxID=135619 RepID=A0A9X5B5K2_9GAMM|nr:AbrB family transcriptional regulator [Halomonas utahensis]MYL73629.1 AbrB family transcriptional regulator [Halomonas sp. 22501_18_FS]